MSNAEAVPNNTAGAMAPTLNRDRIRRLLAAIGSKGAADDTNLQVTPYDWNRPHRFTAAQLARLQELVNRATRLIGKNLQTFCHYQYQVKLTAIEEHFAHEILNAAEPDQQGDYYVAFGQPKQKPAGLIRLPAESAFAWVTQLLGDNEAEDSQRELSQVERSLLLDIITLVVQALSTCLHGEDWQPAGSVVAGEPPIELHGDDTLCKISLAFEPAESTPTELHIVMFCDALERILGEHGPRQAHPRKVLAAAIIERLKQTCVSVTAALGSTTLTFGQVLDLEVGDVVLLDKKVDAPLELLLDDRKILEGRPAQADGRYALVITASPQPARRDVTTAAPALATAV